MVLELFDRSEFKRLNHEKTADLDGEDETDLLRGIVGHDVKESIQQIDSEISSESNGFYTTLDESAPLSRHYFHQFKLTPKEFTKEASEAIDYALEMADCMGQKCETEHLMKALLEQNQGLVPRILAEVSIDNQYLLKIIDEFITCQPKDIGDYTSSVLGLGFEALLQRANEWKEEYGDSLISVEHLLLGFYLDNRIGKYVYKEGNAIDTALKILDAIEILKESPLIKTQEEKHKMGVSESYAISKISMETSIAAPECEHSGIHLYKWCVGWTDVNVKDFIFYLGPFVDAGACPTEIKFSPTCRAINDAQQMFDEMWNMRFLFGNATIMGYFKRSEFDLALGLLTKMKKENSIAWSSLTRFIQSGGSNCVELFHEMVNASNDITAASVNLVGVSMMGIDHGRRVQNFLEGNVSNYDTVIGTTLESVGAAQAIKETPKANILGQIKIVSSAAQFDQGEEALRYLNHLEKTGIKLHQYTILAFDPGGNQVEIGILILEDKDEGSQGGSIVMILNNIVRRVLSLIC